MSQSEDFGWAMAFALMTADFQNGLISRIFSISVSRDFMPYFHFRCVARAIFDRNLIHSADACFLVMAFVGYSRAQLKTFSSLLKLNSKILQMLSFASSN